MKRPFLLLLLLLPISVRSQCLTDSLIINTGYDPATRLGISGGSDGTTPVTDPYWILTAVSPAVATAITATSSSFIEVVPGHNVDVISDHYFGWATNPIGYSGNWISCLNAEYYNAIGPIGVPNYK